MCAQIILAFRKQTYKHNFLCFLCKAQYDCAVFLEMASNNHLKPAMSITKKSKWTHWSTATELSVLGVNNKFTFWNITVTFDHKEKRLISTQNPSRLHIYKCTVRKPVLNCETQYSFHKMYFPSKQQNILVNIPAYKQRKRLFAPFM